MSIVLHVEQMTKIVISVGRYIIIINHFISLSLPYLLTPLLPLPVLLPQCSGRYHKHTKRVSCCMQCVMHVAQECKLTHIMFIVHQYCYCTWLVVSTLILFSEYQPIRDLWRYVHTSRHHLSIGESLPYIHSLWSVTKSLTVFPMMCFSLVFPPIATCADPRLSSQHPRPLAGPAASHRAVCSLQSCYCALR